MCPGLKPLITLNNRLRLCLPRVRAKIISANISWKEGRKEGRKEGKNGGSGKKVIMREAEFSFNIYTDNNETVK